MEKTNNKFEYNDIVEELEEEIKQKEKDCKCYDQIENSLQGNYKYKIKSHTGKDLYLTIEQMITGQYQVCIEIKKYKIPGMTATPFSKKSCVTFNNFNDAKIYFGSLKYKYNGIKKSESEKMEWDDHSIFRKVWRFFKNMLLIQN